jgi:hypothetical protein
VLSGGAICWEFLELQMRKVNARAIYWQLLVLGRSTKIFDSISIEKFDVSTKFLLPTSGNKSNGYKLKFQISYRKKFVKKEAKI